MCVCVLMASMLPTQHACTKEKDVFRSGGSADALGCCWCSCCCCERTKCNLQLFALWWLRNAPLTVITVAIHRHNPIYSSLHLGNDFRYLSVNHRRRWRRAVESVYLLLDYNDRICLVSQMWLLLTNFSSDTLVCLYVLVARTFYEC